MLRIILGRRPQERRGLEKSRGNGVRWKAVIRRRGYPPASQSFDRKTDAEKWARGIEAKIEAGKFRDESQAGRHIRHAGELAQLGRNTRSSACAYGAHEPARFSAIRFTGSGCALR